MSAKIRVVAFIDTLLRKKTLQTAVVMFRGKPVHSLQLVDLDTKLCITTGYIFPVTDLAIAIKH